MKEDLIMNDNSTTILDDRNVEAKKHVGHRVMTVGLNKHAKNIVPYMRTRVQKYFCEDCKVVFDVYNTTEDEKEKEKHLRDLTRED
jgi:hypothetical protein